MKLSLILALSCSVFMPITSFADDDTPQETIVESPSINLDNDAQLNNTMNQMRNIEKKDKSKEIIKKPIIKHHPITINRSIHEKKDTASSVIPVNIGQKGDVSVTPYVLKGNPQGWSNVAKDIVETSTQFLQLGTPIYIPENNNKSSEFNTVFSSLLKSSYMEHGFTNIVDKPVYSVLTYNTQIIDKNDSYPQLYLNVTIKDRNHTLTNISRSFYIPNNEKWKYKGEQMKDISVGSKPKCVQFLTPDYYGDGIQLHCLYPGNDPEE